mgnify:CR=1 FL=1
MVFEATTIVAARRNGKSAIGGDGQVTLAEKTIMKQTACKIRRLYNNQVLAGFAGSVADAFTLFEKFEGKLEAFRGNLPRAAVELAKEWRTDKFLRQLEAMLLVADKEHLLVISGTGEIIEPDDPVVAIGSGGPYALAAAKALYFHSELEARQIVEESLNIASSICIFTNNQITVEEL